MPAQAARSLTEKVGLGPAQLLFLFFGTGGVLLCDGASQMVQPTPGPSASDSHCVKEAGSSSMDEVCIQTHGLNEAKVAEACDGVSSESVATLRAKLLGDVILPGDPEYPSAAQLFFKIFIRRPCLILLCNSTSDVQIGLRYAIDNGLPLSVRSGGHNLMGWSVLDNAVALDLRRLNFVHVLPGAEEAHIGPGALSHDVIKALSLGHARMTTAGGHPTVAVGGFLLGGGHSIIGRSAGIGVDNILGMEVVLADGRVVNVSEKADEHPDLYWGLRGGCGFAFGIVTKFRMRLHRECGGDGSCLAGYLRFASSDMSRVAEAVVQYVPDADRRLGIETATSGDGAVLVQGVFSGRAEDGWEALKPLMNIPNATLLENAFQKTDNYYEAWLRSGGSSNIHHTVSRIRAQTRSAFFKESLPSSAWDGLMQGFLALGIDFNIGVYAMGGAWSAPPVNATAYPHRKFRYNLDLNAVWHNESLDDAVYAWLGEAYTKLLLPSCEPDCEVYCNYAGPLKDYAKSYWGANLGRLSHMKSQWDPHGIFTFPQRIPPAQ
mmetsp:Transcript_60249/g.168222  ORF Transcript_60249/g.168222 Transcript_60249/m.168222 type:complete len:547 (+) Transcript_60249:88-1728(+)